MKKILSILILAAVLSTQALQAYAWGRPEMRGHNNFKLYYTPHYAQHGKYVRDLPGGYMRMVIGGLEYLYWEGMFCRRAENRYIVVSAPMGAVVRTIPQGSLPVVVDGVTYYNINGITYMYTPEGYQVVPQPKKIVIKDYTGEAFTVNIPNPKGGYTVVTLNRSGSGFVGPQGEYYAEFPRIEQLKVMYAR